MSKAIKGMNRDMKCRGHQFAIGETYEVAGTIRACKNGFHSCPIDDDVSPLAVFEYYSPGMSRYFDVLFSGATDRDGTKIASASITIGAEIHLGDLTTRAVEWVTAKCKPAKSKGLNTENYKLALNSGDYGAASNSGVRGAASNSGVRGAALNSGDYGAASNSGVRGAASNSGVRGAASNSGDYGAASNSGVRGAASNSGDYGAASNSGNCGAASNSGDYGAASNSGARGAASNSGDYGAAMSHAYAGKVMGEVTETVLYCTEIDLSGKVVSCAKGITGRGKIKAGVWYCCRAGKLVPVG